MPQNLVFQVIFVVGEKKKRPKNDPNADLQVPSRTESDIGGGHDGPNSGNVDTYERAHASCVVETAPGVRSGSGWHGGPVTLAPSSIDGLRTMCRR